MTEIGQAGLVLRALTNAGWQAYFVGGCVRDRLLGRPVHDWDIATSAPPEAVTALFAHTVPSGIRHGTVTVLLGGEAYEVTTFRTEGAYLDGRRPACVRFVPELREDLSRRDFTVNAMAMDEAGSVTDLFGGREDLAARRIRCVGSPDERFSEDALRMLRALRFSAQLGFSLDPETAAAIGRQAGLCEKLSAERVRDEVEKTLLSPHPELAGEMAKLRLLAPLGVTSCGDLTGLAAAPAERAVRWTGLLLACPGLELRRLRPERRLTLLCERAAEAHRALEAGRELGRCVASFGWEAADCACALAGRREELASLRASGRCVTLRQLAVTGDDLPGLPGRAVGEKLAALLEHVLRCPGDNTRERLLELAKQSGTSSG